MISIRRSIQSDALFSEGVQIEVDLKQFAPTEVVIVKLAEALFNKDLLTQNYAQECDASLEVAWTELYCGDQNLVPRTLKIDLNKTQLTEEAKVLHLKYQGTTIPVQIVK